MKISRDWLKMLAFVTMLIDHVGAVFVDYGTVAYAVLRNIGRISFPVFCILFVGGFFHVKSYKKQFWMLCLFAILSEIPYDMAFYRSFGLEFGHQNVMFSWLLGFILLRVLVYLEALTPYLDGVLQFIQWVVILLFAVVGELLHLDYGTSCQLCIGVAFFLLTCKRQCYWLTAVVVCGMLFLRYQMWGVWLAVIPFCLYDSAKKPVYSWKYLYYIGYPTHLFAFGLVGMFGV